MPISTSEFKGYLRELGKKVQNAARLVKAIEDLEKDPVENVHRIEGLVGKVRKAFDGLPLDDESKKKVDHWLADCTSRLQEHKDELRRAFAVDLEGRLKKQGFELKGHYPELTAGFYSIEVDFDKAEARIWYGPKQELMGKARLSPSEVAKQLERTHKALTARPFNEEKFLKDLYQAYERARSHMRSRQDAPIMRVLTEYVFLTQDSRFHTDPRREHFKGYGRAFFSYDLYRLRQRRLLGRELSLVVATRANTVRRESFLWVPTDDKGNGTVYAYLHFREVT